MIEKHDDIQIAEAYQQVTEDSQTTGDLRIQDLTLYIDANMASQTNQGTIQSGGDTGKVVQDLKGYARSILANDPNQREAVRAELHRAMKQYPTQLDEPRIAEILGEPGKQAYRAQKTYANPETRGQWNRPYGVKQEDL